MNKSTDYSIVLYPPVAKPMSSNPHCFALAIIFLLSLFAYLQPASAEPYRKNFSNGTESGRYIKKDNSRLLAETNRISKPWKQRQRNSNQGWQKSKSGNEYFSDNHRSKKNSRQGSSQYLKREQTYTQEKRKYNSSNKNWNRAEKNKAYKYKKSHKHKSAGTVTQKPYDKFSSDWNRTKKIHRNKWKNNEDRSWVNYKSHKRYPKSGTRHRHVDRHRHDYKIYNRTRYVYYRTPWYSTRYLAPISVHYHHVGYRVSYLPTRHVRIVVNSIPYFYYSGVFYRPYQSSYVVVSAPVGAYVTTLPVGFIAFSIGLSTYYYVNETYYSWDEPQSAYIVVEKPDGADEAIEEATSDRLFAYPKAGQDEEQQAKDRYECHRWGVEESGIDPTIEDEEYTSLETSDYKRAMSACLEGRQYAVK